jgi:beta-lactamase class A
VVAIWVAAAFVARPASGQSDGFREIGCPVADSIGGELDRIARRAGNDVGFAAIHVESGTVISINGERAFPMASVSKIPMALEYLRRVDEGTIDPQTGIVVPTSDFRPGNSPLASWSGGRPVRITIDSLFGLMIGASDNTATDVILNMSGGPAAATARLRQLGIDGVTVDRSEARTFADLSGIPDTVPESDLYRYRYFRLRDALPPTHRDSARGAYSTDPRDTATPGAMATLMTRIHAGDGISAASRSRLLDVMMSTRTGARRLKGLLPSETTVAHKTGTMAGAVNDVGIVTLPDGHGHMAVAAFVNTLTRTTCDERR